MKTSLLSLLFEKKRVCTEEVWSQVTDCRLTDYDGFDRISAAADF